MTKNHIILINDIGTVLFKHSPRAKRIILRIRPFADITVSVPTRVPFKTAEGFVFSKKEWIKKHLEKMKEYEKDRQFFQNEPANVYKNVAKETLTNRLEQLAEKYGFTYDKVSIRNQRTRWGSCSRKNNISLNIKLAILPEDLRDYVILHELVHIRIHNHGEKFWSELENYVHNARAVSKRLKAIVLEFV